MHARIHIEFAHFLRHCTSSTWCSAGWVGSRMAIRGFFRAFCVIHKGQGGGGADAGSVPGVGPLCQLVQAVVDIHIVPERVVQNNNNSSSSTSSSNNNNNRLNRCA